MAAFVLTCPLSAFVLTCPLSVAASDKGLMGNFIWWSKIKHAFLTKIEWTAPSVTLGKRTIALHRNKLDERIHVDLPNMQLRES